MSVSIADGVVATDALLQLGSISSLVGRTGSPQQQVVVGSFYPGGAVNRGSGQFVWGATTAKSLHDGVRVISPTVPWNGSIGDLSGFLAGTGETNPGGSGCWLRIFDRIDPYMAGAIGDGVQNDNAALIGWQNSINKFPNGKARAQVLAGIYLSNGQSINIDIEYVDLYLDIGCKFVSSATSSKGHLLGCVGYAGLDAETTPTRKFAKVWGPGRVDAWNAGSNENAIGFGRYDFVIVDGPTVTAGNKGVTAQYGIGRAEIRNVTVPFAAFRGVTVEDQGTAPDVIIENVVVGTTGDSAILAAGASVRIHDARVDQAHNGNATPGTGAVHINSTATLLYAEALGVTVNNANLAKGVVISGAQDGRVDNINIGASGGNAVDIFNSTAIEIGSVHAPNSPAGAVATGTTSFLRHKTYDDSLFFVGDETIPRLVIGNTALSLTSQTMRLSYFTARKTETATKVRLPCGTTAAGATPTLIRVGIYSVANDGTLALIASTPNDTTLLAAANTVYTKSLSASFVKKAGVRYAVGVLVVSAATMPTLIGNTGGGNITSEFAAAPQLAGSVASQTDLPASVAPGSVSAATAIPYVVVTP